MRFSTSVYVLFLGLTLASCASVKNQVSTDKVEEEVSAETVNQLSEDEQNEFEYLFIEGLKQKQLGNLSSAASIFSSCLEIDPNSAVAMYEMANLHYANNDLTSASLLLEKAISIDDTNKWYKLLLAQIYQQRSQYKEAAALYSDLCEMEPENQEFLYSKAVLLAAAEDFDEALEAYDLLESKAGMVDQITVAKQQIYQQMGEPEKALEEINRLIETDPENSDYIGLLAEYYQMQGDTINALKNFNKILEVDPDNAIVHFSLSNYYIESGDMDKAFEHIKSAFKNQNLDADTKINYYLMQTGDQENGLWSNEQIEELLDILYETYPDDNRMYTIYAEYFIRMNEYEKARENLRKFLETDKSSFVIWQQLIYLDNDLLDYESLYTDSKDAIEFFPNQTVLYIMGSVGALQLEKYDEALSMLEEGEDYVVDNPAMQVQFEVYKAEANYQLDNVEEAFEAFDKVLNLDPDNYMVMNNYAYYLTIRKENLEKAERLSSQVVQANPTNSTYLDTYAWVLFVREDYELAKFYMESAITYMAEDNAVLYEHYGDILIMNDEEEKAIEYWKKAQALEDSEILNQKISESRYIESPEP